MDSVTFGAFQKLAYQHAGITIGENKRALLHARLTKRMRKLGMTKAEHYLAYLSQDRSGTELMGFLDAITTNFTSFFRENEHFEFLSRELKNRLQEGARMFRVWCAAASTGEEPYSLGITLAEALEGSQADFRLLATDISMQALTEAHEGCYEAARLRPIAPHLVRKYFEPAREQEDDQMLRVRDALRAKIVFKRLNLATPPFPMRGDIDFVFCRNVMIYFDDATRQRLVAAIFEMLRPGGVLFIAHSETLTRVPSDLNLVQPSVYRKGCSI
ncbi:MAG TPA: CheR family methyltransferase [Polyangiaceae bacterium]|nr:CheR family methyltransferase [Polyangiaceae bacterium]